MYKKARSGEIKNFTGVSDPYEEPLNPEITVKTDKESVEESVAHILSRLEEFGYIEPADYVYSEEEKRTIQAKLKGLGYIE